VDGVWVMRRQACA